MQNTQFARLMFCKKFTTMDKNLSLTFLGKIQNEFIGSRYGGVGMTEVILSHMIMLKLSKSG